MELTGRYDGVVCRTYARHLMRAEEQRVLPFVCQRPDEPLRQVVVDCVFTVILVPEDLRPEVVEVSHGTSHQVSVPRCAVCKHLVKLVSHHLLDVLRILRVPEELYILRTELLPLVCLLHGIKLTEPCEEEVCVPVMLYFRGIFELCPHMGHAADVLDVKGLPVQVKVCGISVSLQGLDL